MRSQSAPTGSMAMMTVALTPPIKASATPDLAAARRGDPVRDPFTRGCNSQGRSMTAIRVPERDVQVTAMGAML